MRRAPKGGDARVVEPGELTTLAAAAQRSFTFSAGHHGGVVPSNMCANIYKFHTDILTAATNVCVCVFVYVCRVFTFSYNNIT